MPEAASSVSRRHQLWRRTCFEVFFGVPGQSAYWEGNFSPSGDWNCYRFTDYRQGMVEEQRLDRPQCRAAATPTRLELTCSLEIRGLCPDDSVLAVGLACVILETEGTTSYWALDHCGSSADFHDRRSFLLRLPPPCPTREGMV